VGLKLVLEEILAFADDGDACGRRDLVEGVVQALLFIPPPAQRRKL
jgi:hypothetical protein